MQFGSEIRYIYSNSRHKPNGLRELQAKMHSHTLLKSYKGIAPASKQAYILEGNMSILSFPDIFPVLLSINLSLLQFAKMDTKDSPCASLLTCR